MVNQLKSPRDFAGLRAQCGDRIRPLVVARTQATVVVGAGAAGRHENEVTLQIDSHDRPRVRRTAVPFLVTASRRVRRNWIPTPPQSTRPGIEGSNYAAWHIHAIVVIDRRPNHYQVVNHGRWRSHVIRSLTIVGDIAQTNLPTFAEIRTGA